MKIILLLSLIMSSLSWGQTMNNLSQKEKIQYAFDKLTIDTLHIVDEFYHPEVEFKDPVGTVRGTKKLKEYYANMYQNVKTLSFEFSDFIESGNQVVGIWKMTLTTDKLKGGEPIILDGNSVIRFAPNGQVIYHRDYFDMGAFVYENISGLGFIVKKVKERFKVEE